MSQVASLIAPGRVIHPRTVDKRNHWSIAIGPATPVCPVRHRILEVISGRRSSLAGSQSLAQVGNEIGRILEPNREANQTLIDSGSQQSLVVELLMGG